MNPQALKDASALPCATCGYDLRAHSREGVCPECETPVREAVEFAKVPVRPAWRDSDPRWRRRMIAGAWVLVLIPLVEVLQWTGLAARIPVPALYEPWGNFRRLDESFATWIWPYLAFCIGVVLFFSKERNRQPDRLDWTRRWGVFGSYIVLLLGVPIHGLVTALVLIGIATVFMGMPPENQPAVTDLLITLGTGYIYYGPHDSAVVHALAAAFSAGVVLLACVPIYHALRSSGPRVGVLALILLVPLALISLWQIAGAAFDYLEYPLGGWRTLPFFFEPGNLVGGAANLESIINGPVSRMMEFTREVAKWLIFLVIAVWLSIAQVRAWRKPPQAVAAR